MRSRSAASRRLHLATPRLERAPLSLKPVLRRLLTVYLEELAAITGSLPQRDAAGEVAYRYFDEYWAEPERVPFAIWLGDDLAGFCLLRDTGVQWQEAEFFIVSAWRSQGFETESSDDEGLRNVFQLQPEPGPSPPAPAADL